MASSAANVTLASATSVASGAPVDYGEARSMVTAVLVPSGAVKDGLIAMEASQDGTNWVTVYIFSPTTGRNEYHSTTGGVAFRYWRCSVVSAITGGGSIMATLMYSDADGGVL